ncbi:hypothetical protein AD945_07710 [Gluconobacter albidus]|uniref:Uncharacterized protein n=1 Tax=Gluconobacter albidus TaxID=318683 RepID=A0A149TJB8_9PROT|nr:hypothetical protein AD945_07710 [Gluconobacter albidus]
MGVSEAAVRGVWSGADGSGETRTRDIAGFLGMILADRRAMRGRGRIGPGNRLRGTGRRVLDNVGAE